MAEGAGVSFAALLVPNCAEELTASRAGRRRRAAACRAPAPPARRSPTPGCTAVAVACGGRHVVGHNMDWYVVDAPNNVLFDLTGPDGTRLLAFAGAAYLPMVGLNSHGVGNVSNSLHSLDNRVGVPNCFVRRATMTAATLEEARDRGLTAARARGTNQCSPTPPAGYGTSSLRPRRAPSPTTLRAATWRTPTTTWRPRWRRSRAPTHEESRTRLRTAETLLAEGLDHGDEPVGPRGPRSCAATSRRREDCICGHPDQSEPLGEQGMTVGSIICDLDERRLYACAGPPCESPYQVFDMDLEDDTTALGARCEQTAPGRPSGAAACT